MKLAAAHHSLLVDVVGMLLLGIALPEGSQLAMQPQLHVHMYVSVLMRATLPHVSACVVAMQPPWCLYASDLGLCMQLRYMLLRSR